LLLKQPSYLTPFNNYICVHFNINNIIKEKLWDYSYQMADSSHENAGTHVVEANLNHIQTKSNLNWK
jgi:hypothetical protein